MSHEADYLSGRASPPKRRVRWRAAIRIIPSRYPTIELYDRVAEPADFEALYALESLTNPRLRDELGDVAVVPAAERVAGPGASYIMASFTHLNHEGGRFNDATFGAYYAGRTRETALVETRYHRARFMARTAEPPLELEMRVLEARLDARLHDLRGARSELPGIYDPDDYGAGQRLARRLREQPSWGIAYDSVRHRQGQCVAALRPRAMSHCRQAEHLVYVWDGSAISEVYEKRIYPTPPRRALVLGPSAPRSRPDHSRSRPTTLPTSRSGGQS
ncbi:MAG: RES family NAD+ phosphorylase [Longimicrobiales bacterium]